MTVVEDAAAYWAERAVQQRLIADEARNLRVAELHRTLADEMQKRADWFAGMPPLNDQALTDQASTDQASNDQVEIG